jgi:putative Mg2+ transporter-C (MgtC) family protein
MSQKTSPRTHGSELVPELPADEHEEELIDEALTETFPASDPVAVPRPAKRRKARGGR